MLYDRTRKFLDRSGFTEMQADALADMMAEMTSTFATKHDLEMLETRLTGDIESLETRLTGNIESLESRLRGEIKELKADLTWRFIALTAFLGTILSLVNILAA